MTDVRAVFSWSYRALGAGAARLFRLLGIHPGPEVGVPAAASLAGQPVTEVRGLLAELVRAHLLAEHQPGRYGLHDLLRAYAIEQAHAAGADGERSAARHRLLDHYLHTAHAADRAVAVNRTPILLRPPALGVTPEVVSDKTAAMAWFTAEHRVLVAAVELAGATRFDVHAWQLSWALAGFLGLRGHWRDWAATQRVALGAACRLPDPRWQAAAHRDLARASVQLERYDQAQAHIQHAIDLLGELGDHAALAHAVLVRCVVSERLGDHEAALRHSQQALQLFQAAGDQPGQAAATNNIGWFLTLLGEHEQALPYCQRALEFSQQFQDSLDQAACWDSLGLIHHHLGRYGEAVACYQHALELLQELDDRYYRAHTLDGLGSTYQAAGDRASAGAAWRQAAAILEQLGHPDADRVRSKLDDLAAASTSPTPPVSS
jgi:tetratricopeptide (TPR) repeat protein